MPIDPTEAEWNSTLIADLRANDGTVTMGRLAGSSLVVLTTVGARTGEPRLSPLGFSRDGERYVVVGSNSGRDEDPAWVRNVAVNPIVTVEIGGRTHRARATVQDGAERRRLLDGHIRKIPILAQYESMTSRPLPVVTLEVLPDEPEAGTSESAPGADTWEEMLIADIRAHGGRPSTGPLAGHPLLFMLSTGAKSGKPRRAILTYSRDGDDYIVAGPAGGSPTDPAWVGNLRANPNVTVEVAGETYPAVATIYDGVERERLWNHHVEELPWFAPYVEQAGRDIPMIRLRRSEG